MATYNWSIRPGVINKYGFNVSNSADDETPGNCGYVALFGNDITGNGSRMYPWRTLLYGTSQKGNIIAGSGVYREYLIYGAGLYADGDVVIDSTFTTDRMNVGNPVYGVQMRGGFYQEAVYYINYYYNIFDRVSPGRLDGFVSLGRFKFNIVMNTFINVGQENYIVPSYRAIENNTFYNCNILLNGINSDLINVFNQCIFVNCNINFAGILPKYMTYCLFFNCNFRNDNVGMQKELYPVVPTGFTSGIATIEDLRLFLGGDCLDKSLMADPKFNNPEIGDFSLAFDSPAKNLSYFGTYIGAQSIGYSVKARLNEVDSGFDLSTAVNLNIADDNITMIDSNLQASIETKVIQNLIQRELGKAPIYGFNADRNGQYIDSIADLATISVPAGTNLAANTPYIVEDAAIVYNGNAIQPGERFTTTAVLSFTTEGGGICREIIEAPQRHTIMARFADVEADLTTMPYQHYEPGIKFSSNNVGDSRTGAIVRGNGDPLYERGTGKEFPINARFIQVKYIIQPNNLKP